MKISKSQSVITWRQRTKLKALNYLGGKCMICGYDKCVGALHFHHKNPEEKDFNISSKSVSWDKIQKELDKCILVCANCHSELHYKPTLIELLPEKTSTYCEGCKVELKTRGAKVCYKCYRRTFKIDWPSDNELKDLIKESQSMLKVAQKLKVSDNAIRKHCILRNIPYKKT